MFDAFYTECEDRIAREPYEDSAPTNGGACKHACRPWRACLSCLGIVDLLSRVAGPEDHKSWAYFHGVCQAAPAGGGH